MPLSQLSPLVAKLKQSGADRVFFAPNEAGVVLDGEALRPLSGGPVPGGVILAAVSEILSQDDIAGLSNRPRIVRHEHDGEELVFEIVRQANGVALGIRLPARVAPRGAPVVQPARAAAPQVARVDAAPDSSAAPGGRNDVVAAARQAALEVARDAAAKIAREAALAVAREAARDVAIEILRDIPRGGGGGGEVAPRAGGGARERAPARSGPARIDGLLRQMIQSKASDLHLSAESHPVFRRDGEIHFAGEHPALSSADIDSMVREIMPERARNEFDELHDADFAYEIHGLARFRVNAFVDRMGVGAVLRQIPIEILSAEKLGLPKACTDLCWLSKGLVLVTGPTGSGKSTTLAAMIDFINKNRSDHIITIEDPVEFVHKNQKCLVNQREVGQHTKSFKNALRAALREDPDVVLVGELRDLETIAIAIETAETGHLVFGTLHTTTAISTVDRIVDQFPSDRQEQIRVMLSESLKGVVAQVLCPKIGGGRAAAHEILLGNHAVAAMIREGKTFQLASVMQTAKGQGMITMNDSLIALVQQKKVDPKQAYMKAVDKSGFATMLKSLGIAPPV
jgi:twitching motility protein PilT